MDSEEREILVKSINGKLGLRSRVTVLTEVSRMPRQSVPPHEIEARKELLAAFLNRFPVVSTAPLSLLEEQFLSQWAEGEFDQYSLEDVLGALVDQHIIVD